MADIVLFYNDYFYIWNILEVVNQINLSLRKYYKIGIFDKLIKRQGQIKTTERSMNTTAHQ